MVNIPTRLELEALHASYCFSHDDTGYKPTDAIDYKKLGLLSLYNCKAVKAIMEPVTPTNMALHTMVFQDTLGRNVSKLQSIVLGFVSRRCHSLKHVDFHIKCPDAD